uniref:TE1b n=1 Tax=Blumeria hordei TaxID=2867405 RepID=A8U3R2_BLUHO|nr:TE1b [Blumeria hordei]
MGGSQRVRNQRPSTNSRTSPHRIRKEEPGVFADQECKLARAECHAVVTPEQRWVHAEKLRSTLRAAKKEHQTRQVEAITTPTAEFKLMRSAEPRQASSPPPLNHDGKMYADPAERAVILRDALLARHQATDDLPPLDVPSTNRIPWNDHVSDEEIRICTMGCVNTAPGADGISVELLQTCWKTIGPFTRHPFKLAEVVLIRKMNRDPTTVKGWRPIALLSCLGKELERLLAKRMAHLAVTLDVAGHQQFGALHKRSANDLVTCVVHDIEEASTQEWAVTFTTLDVQGAFDAVLHNRLLQQLGFWRSIAESAAIVQKEVDHLLEWLSNNAVSFDTNKSEVVQFPGRKREEPVGIRVNGVVIESADQIRWLGVHLDPRLDFKHHVTTWCGKALNVAQQMRRFNSAYRGAAPAALVRAVDTCIVPIATFGADVWWPRLKRPTGRGIITPRTSIFCEMIDKAILTGLRAALPVTRTTPNLALHREVGIPTGKIMLEGNRLRLSTRLHSLDNRHPLRTRAAVCPIYGTLKYKKIDRAPRNPEIHMSRVQRAYRELLDAEDAEPLPPACYPSSFDPRIEEEDKVTRLLHSVQASDICAYSDRSSEGHGRSAWGFVLKRDGKTLLKGCGIKHGGEVLDAEILGARKALEAALEAALGLLDRENGGRNGRQRVNVLIDSQSVVKALSTGTSTTSLDDVHQFRALSKNARVSVKWIPAHSGIEGNEEADRAARFRASGNLPIKESQPGSVTLAYVRRLMNQKRQALLDDWWEESCPPRYRKLCLLMRRRKPREQTLSRRLLRELISARTGHGNFASCHRRFNNFTSSMECACGGETSSLHFIHYRLQAHQTRRLRGTISHHDFAHKLLGPKCLENLTRFAQETGCFGHSPVSPSPTLSGDGDN